MTFTTVLAILLSFLEINQAAPAIALPVNSQVPPVAQVGQTFTFVFSYNTFSSPSQILEYALANSPSWLRLDSNTRTLFGTPQQQDVGSTSFEIAASDGTGSCTMPVTLVVSDTPGLGLGQPISEQLPTLGTFEAPDALLLYPQSPINLRFSPETFSGIDAATQFYAMGVNNTPLPSWLKFDPSTLSFYGSTPVFNSPTELPQNVDVSFVATNIPGFSQAVASFRITVESHQLLFDNSGYTIDVEPGEEVVYTGLQGKLTMDGKSFSLSNVSHVSADLPSWLSLDARTFTISGTAPENVVTSSFTISVSDYIGDTGTATISISAPGGITGSSLILGTFQPLNVTIGSFFNYTLERSDFAPGNISIAVDMGNASSWLHFDQRLLSLSGTAPPDSRPQTDSLNIMVSLGGQEQSQVIPMNLVYGGSHGPSSTVSFIPSSSATGGAAASNLSPGSLRSSSGTATNLHKLIPAILCPIVGMFLALLIFYCWRRCRRNKYEKHKGKDMSKVSITRVPRRVASVLRKKGLYKKFGQQESWLPVTDERKEPMKQLPNRNQFTQIKTVAANPRTQVALTRPTSTAPQISQTIMERGPDPLCDFRESHNLIEQQRLESAMLPEPPKIGLDWTRSQSEPPRRSYMRKSGNSVSSFLDKAATGRLSALLTTIQSRQSRQIERPQLEYNFRDTKKEPRLHRQNSLEHSANQKSTNGYDFQDYRDLGNSRIHVRETGEGQTTSESWTTTSESVDPSSQSGDHNTSSIINDRLGPGSAPRRHPRSGSRFAHTTIRGVTPSLSSRSGSRHSKRGSRSSIHLRTKHHSQGSFTSEARPTLIASPNKHRSSRDFTYSQFLKQRRQQPAPIRFSNPGTYRSTSSSINRDIRNSDIESRTTSSSNDRFLRPMSPGADKENRLSTSYSIETSNCSSTRRKRSRASVQKLGQQMQAGTHPQLQRSSTSRTAGKLPFAPRSNSMRSTTTATTSMSDPSMRAIEEQLEAIEEQARRGRFQAGDGGYQRRTSSWHRLSALPEGHTGGVSSQEGPEVKLVESNRATPMIGVEERERSDGGGLPLTQSFKGELGEWETDTGSVSVLEPQGTDFEASSPGCRELGSKAFI